MELSDNQQVELEITALEKMNELALAEKPSVEVAKIDSPIERVEEKLSDFVSNMFIATREDIEFNKKIQEELLSRLPNLSENQLLSLFTNSNVNTNDKISKLLGPTFGTLQSRQQAEIAAAAKKEQMQQAAVNVNINQENPMKIANDTAPKEALRGLNTLFQLMNAMNKEEKQ